MRGSFVGVLLLGFGALSLACSGADSEGGLGTRDRVPASTNPGGGGGTSTQPDDPAKPACIDVPAPIQIAKDQNASDVHLTKHGVIYRSATEVMQVGRDGAGAKLLFRSSSIVRSWADDSSIVLIETTADTDTATLRVIPFDKLPDPSKQKEGENLDPLGVGIAAPTGLNAASTQIFASDATGFYIQAENAGDAVLYRVEKANPAQMTLLTTSKGIVSNPLLATDYVWYVVDGQRVYKVGSAKPIEAGAPGENGVTPLGAGLPPGPAQEVFGISYANFRLAVDSKSAFYSTGNALEKRDLTGANPMTVFDMEKSKAKAPFAALIAEGDTLVLPSNGPDPSGKGYIIRTVKLAATGTAEEKLASCGRDASPSNVVVDKASIAWSESGRGVFLAPR